MSTPTPPVTGPAWPPTEPLRGTPAVVARPRPRDAAVALALFADPALWVDVPVAWRTTTMGDQQRDIAAYREHWAAHGFGYWFVWDGAPPGPANHAGALLGIGGLQWLWWRGAWALNVHVRFAAAHHRRGLATATLSTAIDRLDARLPVPTTVVVRTRPANEAMARLSLRLGFVDVGTQERELGTYRVLARTIGVTDGGSGAG